MTPSWIDLYKIICFFQNRPRQSAFCSKNAPPGELSAYRSESRFWYRRLQYLLKIWRLHLFHLPLNSITAIFKDYLAVYVDDFDDLVRQPWYFYMTIISLTTITWIHFVAYKLMYCKVKTRAWRRKNINFPIKSVLDTALWAKVLANKHESKFLKASWSMCLIKETMNLIFGASSY